MFAKGQLPVLFKERRLTHSTQVSREEALQSFWHLTGALLHLRRSSCVGCFAHDDALSELAKNLPTPSAPTARLPPAGRQDRMSASAAAVGRRLVRAVGALSLGALLWSCASSSARTEPTASSVSTTASATQSPTPPPTSPPTPSPTPSPTSTSIGFTVQQLVLPLGDFPLSGYKITRDQGTDDHWNRLFEPLAPDAADYPQVVVDVAILADPSLIPSFFKCEASQARGGSSGGVGPVSATDLAPPKVGDRADACSFAFADGFTHLDIVAALHDVFLVHVQVAARSRVAQSAAVDQAVLIAERQIAMIDRLSR